MKATTPTRTRRSINPVVLTAAAVTSLSALAHLYGETAATSLPIASRPADLSHGVVRLDAPAAPAAPRGVSLVPMPCGPRSLPDGMSCVPLPTGEGGERAASRTARGSHRSPRRGLEDYEHIPRRPERPADVALYAFPVAGSPPVVSDYDLGLPGAAQRKLPHEVGHGAIDLLAPRGEPVTALSLTGQEGLAEVLYVGELFGTTIVTSHSVREGGQLRQYLVVLGHLERTAPGLSVGAAVAPGDPLGNVGDTGCPGNVHLHVEARLVREGVEISGLAGRDLVDRSVSIATDPRNVLPLK